MKYDLEERTLIFTKNTLQMCRRLPHTIENNEIIKQLVRSAGSIGANYREANDSLGRKDFAHKIKIARKESKETLYWLEIISEVNKDFSEEINRLMAECTELRNILSAILKKFEPL